MFKKETQSPPDYHYFALFDTKVGVYREPMLSINQFALMRDLEALFRDPQHANNPLVTNSEDFQLFRIGNYSKRTGALIGHQPEHVINLHELRSMVMRNNIPRRNDAPRDIQNIPEDINQLGIVST